jgi:hypothetical protein
MRKTKPDTSLANKTGHFNLLTTPGIKSDCPALNASRFRPEVELYENVFATSGIKPLQYPSQGRQKQPASLRACDPRKDKVNADTTKTRRSSTNNGTTTIAADSHRRRLPMVFPAIRETPRLALRNQGAAFSR